MNKKSGFSLVELLVILIIISVLTGIVTIVSKPSDTLQKSRDTKRESDLRSVDRLISSMSANDLSFDELKYAASGTLYLSLSDSSSTCGSYSSQLPSLPSGWSYRCSATPTDITGQGWIPIPFSSNPLVNISNLPLDPINKPPYYYTFTANQQGYELTALKERGDEEIIVSTARERLISLNRKETVPQGQEEPVLWFKVYGSNASEYPSSLIAASDGGYVMVGEINISGNDDILVIKTDSSGKIEWSRSYGTNSEDSISGNEAISLTSDGGYVIAGYTYVAGNYDFLVFKINSLGNLQWAKRIGGINFDNASSVFQDSSGNLVISGFTNSFGSNGDVLIVKLDLNGNLVSAKNIGSSSYERPSSIRQAPDGDYVVIGVLSDIIFIFKISSNLNSITWSKKINYGSYYYFPYSLEITSDNGYIFVMNGFYDPMIILKLTSSGTFSWARSIGVWDDVIGSSIKQTQDGGYVILGSFHDYGIPGAPNAFIMKLNSSLSLNWLKIIGSNNEERASSMLKFSGDNYFLILGYTDSYSATNDFFLAKVDSSGNINNCSIIQPASSTIESLSVTVSSQTFSINTPSSLSINSLSLNTSTPSIPSQTICSAQ